MTRTRIRSEPRGPLNQYLLVLAFRLPVYLAIISVAHALYFYRRSQARERHGLELEAGLAKARLEALQMQLQPHFLFNSLNAIAALIHKDPDAADEMVAALSDFLRLTLENRTAQELPLRRELEFVERYLAIEKVRFGERLQFVIDTPSDTLLALVPALVLQPLVENAVRHGLEPKMGGGSLTITARRSDEELVLTVEDNGAGFHGKTPSEGIGLVNTRARLGELYGDAARLEMRNGDGVEVRITLPYHTVAA
jgi:LytS/YehU family sensor histidine kinase